MKRLFFAFFWIFTALGPVGCGGSEGLSSLKIIAPDGSLRHRFEVELAQTPSELAQGLMYRKELGADRGMLFLFPQTTQTAFWMKNTLIPLDMVFIGDDRKIVSIVERAAPQTTTPRQATGPFRYVLEVEGGRTGAWASKRATRLNFKEGFSYKKRRPSAAFFLKASEIKVVFLGLGLGSSEFLCRPRSARRPQVQEREQRREEPLRGPAPDSPAARRLD
jgi:uncharacterized membrane protein (UPF0127 family)